MSDRRSQRNVPLREPSAYQSSPLIERVLVAIALVTLAGRFTAGLPTIERATGIAVRRGAAQWDRGMGPRETASKLWGGLATALIAIFLRASA